VTDIEPVHRIAYEEGHDPIEHAVWLAAMTIEVRDQVVATRVHTPSAFPIVKFALTDDATARRIIAVLLDAGWTPPQTATTQES
jgi:hypothetical protein